MKEKKRVQRRGRSVTAAGAASWMTPKQAAAFAHRLRAEREKLGFERRELAELLNVHQGTVSVWERSIKHPRRASIEHVANILGVSYRYMLGATDDPERQEPGFTTTSLLRSFDRRRAEVLARQEEERMRGEEEVEEEWTVPAAAAVARVERPKLQPSAVRRNGSAQGQALGAIAYSALKMLASILESETERSVALRFATSAIDFIESLPPVAGEVRG